MGKIKFYFSLIIAQLMFLMLKITKLSSGTAFIGLVVLKICPDFLKYANNYVTEAKINVTGTNGKTTTSAIIAQVLKYSGRTLLYNSTGANMLTGIVNSMSLQINPFGKKEYSIIESDEGFLKKIYEKYDADYLVITNLFEDQLDRYGSVEGTKKLIQDAINMKDDLQLILNADDPFIADITTNGNKSPIYYGVNSITHADDCNINDIQQKWVQTCTCGEKLSYSKQFYSKIGHYSCSCGYVRPNPKYSADIVIYKNSCELKINGEVYKAPLMGIFNAYNALAAISLLLEIGISSEIIQKAIANYKVFSGRCEYKRLNKHKVLIQLIKNPVGATEVLKTVDLNSNIFIAVNDNAADGRDFSWINDVEFELIKNAKKEIVVSGLRAKDLEQKLKVSGCSKIKVISDLTKAVSYLDKTAEGDITMLPNYTALQKLDKMHILKK